MQPPIREWERLVLAFGFTSLIMVAGPLVVGAAISRLTPAAFTGFFTGFAAGNLVAFQAAALVLVYRASMRPAQEPWRRPALGVLSAGVLVTGALVALGTSASPPSVNLGVFVFGILFTPLVAVYVYLQLDRLRAWDHPRARVVRMRKT